MDGLKYMNKKYLFRLVILIGMSLPKIVANNNLYPYQAFWMTIKQYRR